MTGQRRQKQKEETRRLLLDTAYDLFQEKGYDQATVRELAARAQVAQGTIFKHFPDKPSLVAAVFKDDLQAVVEDAFRNLPSQGIQRQLLYITRRLYEFYQPRPALFRVLISQAVLIMGDGGSILNRLLDDFFRKIAELFKTAMERGELARDTDANQAALAYGSFYFMGLNTGLGAETFDVDSMVDMVGKMLAMLIRGIGTPACSTQTVATSRNR